MKLTEYKRTTAFNNQQQTKQRLSDNKQVSPTGRSVNETASFQAAAMRIKLAEDNITGTTTVTEQQI